jgi:hypothetical protein
MEKGGFLTMEDFNRKIMVGSLAGLFLFLWMGYFCGYFVATDKAMTGVEQREAEWDSHSKTAKARANNLSRENAGLTVKLQDLEREMQELRLKNETLQRQARQAQTDLSKVRGPMQENITQLERSLAWKSVELSEAHALLAKKRMVPTDHFQIPSPLTVQQIVTAKNAFHDIQHEVAAGNFKGLNLVNGYQRLKTIFDNPDLEHLVGAYDTAKGEGR